jgi:hypothetical protein
MKTATRGWLLVSTGTALVYSDNPAAAERLFPSLLFHDQQQFGAGAAAGAASAAGVTVHLHGVSAVDGDPTAALRQAQFAAQAVFGS